MKVTTTKNVRVKIVLEGEDEASLMWHLLNCSSDKNFNRYRSECGIGFEDGEKSVMWQKLNASYRPHNV